MSPQARRIRALALRLSARGADCYPEVVQHHVEIVHYLHLPDGEMTYEQNLTKHLDEAADNGWQLLAISQASPQSRLVENKDGPQHVVEMITTLVFGRPK